MEPLPARLSQMLLLQLSARGGVGMDEYLMELVDRAIADTSQLIDDLGRARRSETRICYSFQDTFLLSMTAQKLRHFDLFMPNELKLM